MSRLRTILIVSACLGGLALLTDRGEAKEEENWVAIRGATIWTVTKGRIEGGTILLKDGKIAGVGKRLEIPHSAEVIDAAGKHVIPGLVDIRSDLFLGSGDSQESRKVGAELDVADALDLFSPAAEQVLREGVTAVYVGPGSRGLVGGLGAVVRLGTGPDLESAILKRGAALKVSLGVSHNQRTSAEWRLGHYHEIRGVLQGAERYRDAWEKYEKELGEYKEKKAEFDKKEEAAKKEASKKKKDPKAKKDEPPKKPRKPRKDPGQEVLVRALAGKILVRLETERSDSIRNAIDLAEEFRLSWALEGGAEAKILSSLLAKKKVPVILGPVVTTPLGGVDATLSRSETAGVLSRAGVEVAIGSGDGGGLASRYLRYQACLAARHGMDREAALRAVTIVPAKILGVSDRIGSIEEGKEADLVILDGDPLKSLSRVTHVVRGEKVVRVAASVPERREF